MDFNDFAGKFEDLADKIANAVKYEIPRSSGDTRKSLIAESRKDLNEATNYLQKMRNEKNRQPDKALSLQPKISRYETDLATLTRDLNAIANSTDSMRAELFSGGTNDNPWDNHNARIQQSLEKSSNSVDNSLRVGAETEVVAENIISNLGKQRKQLENAESNLTDINQNMSKSRRILTQMYARVLSNKLVLILIIIMELIAIAVLLYLFLSSLGGN